MMKSVHILGLWALLRSFFLCLPSHISGKWTVHSRYQFERPAHMDRIGSFDMPVDRHTDAMAYQPKKFTLRGLTYCDGMQCPLPSVELYSGNEISFSIPSSHNVLFDWKETPQRVMLLSKPDPDIYPQVREALLHLLGLDLEVFVEPSMLSYLEVNDLVHNLPSVATEACQQQNRQYQQQDCHYPVDDIVDSLGDRSMAVNNHSSMGNKYISRNSDKSQDTVDRVCKMQGGASELVRRPILHTYTTGCKVDLVITFGGDGLLLHCNTLFGSSPVPPVMGFDFGSLGFLSPFQFDEFQPELGRVLQGQELLLTLRMRLECTIWRNKAPNGTYCVLNEVVMDRGPSPFLSVLDLSCHAQHITTLQGDGIIFATPTGSTAYSLAAGGPVVYPSVPAILLTPVCAHSLSFRPMLLPDTAVLTCEVPDDCRSSGWVSFDGKFRQEVAQGDWLEVRMSPHPLPTIERKDTSTGGWLDALRAGFMYNVRRRQKGKTE